MKRFQSVGLSVLLALVTASAWAQTPARIRGTITAVDGNMLSVKSREGKDLSIGIEPDATYSYMKKLGIDEVKPGMPLGTSALAGPDGKIVALELHLFPAGRPAPNEGHRPWDLQPN